MLTVEVGCVFGTSNIGFQNIPRILGQVDLSSGWLLYLWALREGRFGTEPKMAEVKRFSCTALFLSEWLRTKIPKKTEETKNVLDTWQLGPRLFQGFGPRIQNENGRPQGWGLHRFFLVFDVTVSFLRIRSSVLGRWRQLMRPRQGLRMADTVWELGDFLWWILQNLRCSCHVTTVQDGGGWWKCFLPPSLFLGDSKISFFLFLLPK